MSIGYTLGTARKVVEKNTQIQTKWRMNWYYKAIVVLLLAAAVAAASAACVDVYFIHTNVPCKKIRNSRAG